MKLKAQLNKILIALSCWDNHYGRTTFITASNGNMYVEFYNAGWIENESIELTGRVVVNKHPITLISIPNKTYATALYKMDEKEHEQILQEIKDSCANQLEIDKYEVFL